MRFAIQVVQLAHLPTRPPVGGLSKNSEQDGRSVRGGRPAGGESPTAGEGGGPPTGGRLEIGWVRFKK